MNYYLKVVYKDKIDFARLGMTFRNVEGTGEEEMESGAEESFILDSEKIAVSPDIQFS